VPYFKGSVSLPDPVHTASKMNSILLQWTPGQVGNHSFETEVRAKEGNIRPS